jgi:hypothetical protein
MGAFLWWMMTGGWAGVIQGENISQETKRRQLQECLVLMGAAYVLMFGLTVYYSLT